MRSSFNKKKSRKFLSSFQNSSIENREELSSLIRTHSRDSHVRLHDLSSQNTKISCQHLQNVSIKLSMHLLNFTRKMTFLRSEQNYHAETFKESSYHELLKEKSEKSSSSSIYDKNEMKIRR